MKFFKNYFDDWSKFEKLWLITVCMIMTAVWYLNGDTPYMLILSLTGSLNLVLGAKGKLTGLYFAIINSLLYAYQCFSLKLYGEVMYNFLYSIPVSIIAIILWKKNTKNNGEIKFRTMSIKLMIAISFITIIGVLGYSSFLKLLGGKMAFMDSLTTVVSVIASILYLLRFSEQWLMWLAVNALLIVMWIMIYVSGDSSSLIIIVMKITNLLNCLYGYFTWRKIAQKKNF